jgi:hypothetical protein
METPAGLSQQKELAARTPSAGLSKLETLIPTIVG